MNRVKEIEGGEEEAAGRYCAKEGYHVLIAMWDRWAQKNEALKERFRLRVEICGEGDFVAAPMMIRPLQSFYTPRGRMFTGVDYVGNDLGRMCKMHIHLR